MEKGISRGHVFTVGATILMAVIVGWMTMAQRVRALEVGTGIRLDALEIQVDQNECHYLEILKELQELNIKLVNKEDRN